MQTIISIYSVDVSGRCSLTAANVPFWTLQWTRRLSSCGDWSASLVGTFPLPWPGRYLLARSDRPEVGVIEKVSARSGEDGDEVEVSGRFAECVLDRRAFGPGGASVDGADWRQAVTRAFAAWPMPDAPRIAMGEGTHAQTGHSYALRVKEGRSGMDEVLSSCAANGGYPALSLDWEAGGLVLAIRDGLDRTRAQSVRPPWMWSLEMATASSVSYSGDWSPASSRVLAFAKPTGEGGTEPPAVTAEADVPGFDQDTMWQGVAAEDVTSLCSDSPDASEVASGARLRSYDHCPALAIDMDAMDSGYAEAWDLGDTCEVAVPAAGVTGTARIEEVREVVNESGATLEVQLGTKEISRAERTVMRLR